jgi:hypothetical protein
LACVSQVLASSETPEPPPEVSTLTVSKDVPNGSVVLNWTDGTASFAVERSESANFLAPTNLIYVTRNSSGGPISDAVLGDGKSYFYLISDANSRAEVYAVAAPAATAYEGQSLTIDGVGFSATCVDNTVFFDGGVEGAITSCSSTQIVATIPTPAISGSVVVSTPNGTSKARRQNYAIGLASNPARQNLAHLAVDASHNVFLCDQGTNDRVWKLTYSTGALTQCGLGFGDPVGLPKNEFGTFNASTHSISTASAGTVREIDPATCNTAIWGPSGTGGSDPVDPRALAYDKSGANNSWTFVLDHTGDRIRRRGNMSGMDTTWLTGLGLGGDTAAASNPAGLTFNAAGEFFFTAQSTIKHYNASRSLIETFPSSIGLNHPAQIETDANSDLWVANRDGNNILKIRPNAVSPKSRVKVSGITSPRGLALDVDPVTSDGWLYVADQTNVYRFRVYDSIRLDVKVLNESLGPGDTQETVRAEIQASVEQAKAAFTQCGIDVVLENISFIADPNARGGLVRTQTTRTGIGCPVLTNDEQGVLGISRASDTLVINVYYVKYLEEPDAPFSGTLRPAWRAGATYTNDCYTGMDEQTQGGIIATRFSRPFTGTAVRKVSGPTILAHEIGHFVMNQRVQPGFLDEHWGGGEDPSGNPTHCVGATNEQYLMYGTACGGIRLTTGSGSECENIRTNTDEGVFVELF